MSTVAKRAQPGDVDNRDQASGVIRKHLRDVDRERASRVADTLCRYRGDVVAAEVIVQLVELVAANDAAQAERGHLAWYPRVGAGHARNGGVEEQAAELERFAQVVGTSSAGESSASNDKPKGLTPRATLGPPHDGYWRDRRRLHVAAAGHH
ncbi:MAG: hypothetical protein Q7R30_07515 [Acidobacteriota bacterium]|nr:hypothetical protein [Acidobacteriota bacterium]